MSKTVVDWPRVLEDIAACLGELGVDEQRVPCSTSELASAIGVSRGMVRGWLDGAEPKHAHGESVIAIWCRLTGKHLAFAPRTRAPLSAAQVRR